jgi:DNA ligase-1
VPKPTLKSWPMLYKKATTGKIQEWEISLNPKGTTVEIVTTYGQRGGKKVTTYETISEGKNEGKANATSVLDQATKEAEAKWKKQQDRRHYSLDATGGESADKRGKACMLAKSFEDYQDEVPETGTFALQPKLDGFRCNAHWDAEEKTVTLISREGKVFTTLPHISAAVKAMMKDEPSAILDGELWTEELRFSKIASAVKNVNNPPAYAEQVCYHLYDIMVDEPFRKRYIRLCSLVDGDQPAAIVLVPTEFITNDGIPRSKIIEKIKQYEQECVKLGFEGAMYRNCFHGYENGKRSKNLLKVKSFIDAEFKVVGWKKAKDVVMKGSAGGDVPVFTCVMPDGKQQFDVLAPGTVKEKKAFMTNIGDWIGKQLTVKYFELTDDGVPRFPVAKAFR